MKSNVGRNHINRLCNLSCKLNSSELHMKAVFCVIVVLVIS